LKLAATDEHRTEAVVQKSGTPIDRGGESQGEGVNAEVVDEADVATTEGNPPAANFAKVEKSLASLGFFSPASHRVKNRKVKKITFTREADGKRVEASAEIVPGAIFGLPMTSDQDKWLALQKIITTILQTEGTVTNPIRFKSADLIRLLNTNTTAGKNYKEVSDWLDVMSSTTIISNGVVYDAGKQRFVRDRFRVFDRAVSVGKELEDGTIADANYVWLSSWQLENINQNFLLPLDFETYRQLKNHIAKALVPLLQIWLFASHKAGSFEKRYEELCEILTLQTHKAPSLITRQLRPSLDELVRFGYLDKWRIEKTSDKKSFKIVFVHGPKFHRDRRKRLEQKSLMNEPTVIVAESETLQLPEPGRLTPEQTEAGTKLVAEEADFKSKVLHDLSSRGVMPSAATRLLRKLTRDQLDRERDYIDYWDSIARSKEVTPGLLITLIKTGQPLPTNFVTRRQREELQAAATRNQQIAAAKATLTNAYDEYCWNTVDAFIREQLGVEEFERRVAGRKNTLAVQGRLWDQTSPELADSLARQDVRKEIAAGVSLLSFESFRTRELPRLLIEMQLDPVEFGIETLPQA